MNSIHLKFFDLSNKIQRQIPLSILLGPLSGISISDSITKAKYINSSQVKYTDI